jgi:hypothetical protein
MFGKPVIGYVAAARGLPAELRAHVRTADSPGALGDLLAAAGTPAAAVPADDIAAATDHSARTLSQQLQRVTRGD